MVKETRTAYILLFFSIAAYLVKYGLNVFLARNLAQSIYGDFSIAIKTLNVLVALSLFGTNVGANRFFGKYFQMDNKADALNYLVWNFKLLRLSFFIILSIALASSVVMFGLHYFGINDINNYHLAVYALWLVPFAAIVTLLSSFLMTSNRIFLSTLVTNFFKFLIQIILFAMVVLFLDPALNNFSIILILLITFIFLGLFALAAMNKEILNLFMMGWKKMGDNSPILNTEWWKTSYKLIANSLVFLVASIIDLLIVEGFASDEALVGHYAAILTIVGAIWLIPTNAYHGLKPKLGSQLATKEGRKELQKNLDKTNAVVITLCVILGGIIIIFSQSLLAHFGPDYKQAALALTILTWGVTFSCMANFAPVILIYAGYEGLVLSWSFAELVVMIIVVIPATIYFNIIGTAAATACILLIKPIALTIITHKKLGLRASLFF